MLSITLPQSAPYIDVGADEVLMITNADLREPANRECWPVQKKYENLLADVLAKHFGRKLRRAHPIKKKDGHGFIAGQREGCDIFSAIAPEAPVIVLLTAWQYSHHLASSLALHKGPILLLANFDGTWPGLVGMLCMSATLNSLGRPHSRLWSENFNDTFFLNGLGTWLKTGNLTHDTAYLHPIDAGHAVMKTQAGQAGARVGEWILRHKEIIGLFDSFCMGMINGVFPQKALIDIGIPMESLSQSELLVEMAKVPQSLREECLRWYETHGMKFQYGRDPSTELVREQVLEQCAMLIAMARYVRRFGLSAVGVQYQQGLAKSCAASDFAEGAIGSRERFPIPDENGQIIRPGQAIPCLNEVDMGHAIPAVMLWRLLHALGLPAETTLHDVRWGSEFEGVFYWDMEISGSVPFEHLKDGISGATGYRQPPMYFPKGGATITGQGKTGTLIWARAYYEGTRVLMHVGTGKAVELPTEEFLRRRRATCYEWPLLNCTLDGVSRDDFMAGHQSNHITVAYVPADRRDDVLKAFVAQALTQGIAVSVAGDAVGLL